MKQFKYIMFFITIAVFTATAITFIYGSLIRKSLASEELIADSGELTEASMQTTEKIETAPQTEPETEPETEPVTEPVTEPATEPEPETEAAPPEVVAPQPAPPVFEVSEGDFSDALFIGDSRTIGLRDYGGLTGATFFATSGLNVFRAQTEAVMLTGIGKVTLSDVLCGREFERIYIMLGMNEIGYDSRYVIEKYSLLVDEIKKNQPWAIIYIEANLHIIEKRSQNDAVYNNTNLNILNSKMAELANGETIKYIDVNPLFDDESGNLRADYTVDDFHLIGKYYTAWGSWIREATA